MKMITAEQRQLRRQFVTASDVPAICGLDPYKSAADVWAQKRGLLADEAFSSKAAERGQWLERSLLDFAEHKIGETFRRDTMVIAQNGIMAANFDGIGETFAVEAKTSRLTEGWGDPGTSEVPDRVKIQTAAQFEVAGPLVARIYVPALVAMDLRLYVVDRDDELVGAVVDRCRNFRRMVDTGERPSESMSMDVLKRLTRVPDKVAPIPAETFAAWQTVGELVKSATEEADDLKAKLIDALGDAEFGEIAGVGLITYLQSTRRGIDVEKLRREFPDAAAACETSTTFRALRFKAHKQPKGATK